MSSRPRRAVVVLVSSVVFECRCGTTWDDVLFHEGPPQGVGDLFVCPDCGRIGDHRLLALGPAHLDFDLDANCW